MLDDATREANSQLRGPFLPTLPAGLGDRPSTSQKAASRPSQRQQHVPCA